MAHYIRRGFTQKDATAEALLDARLAQPHTPQTNQEQPPRKETVSINGIRIRRTALIDPTEDDMTPATKRTEKKTLVSTARESKVQENPEKPGLNPKAKPFQPRQIQAEPNTKHPFQIQDTKADTIKAEK